MVKRGSRLVLAVLWSSAGVLLAGGLGGCELILDTGSLTEQAGGGSPDGTSGDDAGGDTGSSRDGASVDGANDGGAATDGDAAALTDAPPCSGNTYYVSSSKGSDSNPGCSPSQAKQTILAGIVAASAYASAQPTIEVCAGNYAESNLVLNYSGSLLGGFDCTSWDRADGGAGNTTTITNQSPSTQPATLTVYGSAVKVDGFTIVGATGVPAVDGGAALTYSALQVSGTGSPTVSNNVLTGGSGVGGAPASTGIYVDSAAPTILDNVISGGSGTGGATFAPASVGIFVTNSGAPVIQGNTIDGGSGTAGPTAIGVTASAGIMSQGSAGNLTIVGNTVSGGNGVVQAQTSSGAGSMAMWIGGNSANSYTVTGNTFAGGTGHAVLANNAAFSVRAVLIGATANLLFAGNTVDGGVVNDGGECPQAVNIAGNVSSGVVTVTGNRIHAGTCGSSAVNVSPTALQVGLRIAAPFTSVTVSNNMIDGGEVDQHRFGVALLLVNVIGGQVRHNTLVAGPSQSLNFALWLEGGTKTSGTVLENNVFGAVGPNGVAMNDDNAGACESDGGPNGVSTFRNNLLFGTPTAFLREGCSPGLIETTLAAMEATLAAAGATAGNNVTLAESCVGIDGGTSECVPLACAADGGSCLDTVFAGWDDSSGGAANLFSDAGFAGTCPATAPPVVGPIGDGWAFAAGAGTPPCAVVHSTLSDVGDGGVSADLYGNCRGPQPSMGAAEYPPDAQCF